MKKHFFVVAAVVCSSQLLAQKTTTKQPDSTHQILDEVVVTANKYPTKQSETGKVITVINKGEISKNGGNSLSELLNRVSGTTIIGANNVLGTNMNASIRGSAAGNVLILLDGIPVNDPSVISNYFDLNFINLSQVNRIEVLKGGQSTLYGSDAVAGVINIISEQPLKNTTKISGDFSGGSYNTLQESIGITGNKQGKNFGIHYTHIAADGFSAATDKNNSGSFDKDGFNQHILQGSFGCTLGKKITATLKGNYSYYTADLDGGSFIDEKDHTVTNNNQQAVATFLYRFKKGNIHANYSYHRVERDYLDDSSYVSNPVSRYAKSNFIGATHFAELYTKWQWQNVNLLGGIDYRLENTNQSFYSTGIYGPYAPPNLEAQMHQLSPYASFVYQNKKGWHLELGSRLNIHSTYGKNLTFTLNPAYIFSNKIKVFANFYSAYKVPSLYQLFDAFAGNQHLQPEKSNVGEIGMSLFTAKNFSGRITGFYRKATHTILYTYNPVTFSGIYLNAGEQQNYGIEMSLHYKKGNWRFDGNYTFTDGQTKAGFDGAGNPIGKDTTYYNLYRIPKHAINLTAGWQLSKAVFLSVRTHTVSRREEYVFGAAPATLKGYTLVNIYAEYAMGRPIKWFLQLKNITNTKYVDFLGYNTKRFNFATGIHFEF